ncbi:MAG: AbrB/MazE/SpoVT family DNA-binding domain-containing protein [Thermoproteales archaeon]|nr:AbrB/MazE/SpoVT family DNA-binding domain-containing protein [Thermoproteales archaeon]
MRVGKKGYIILPKAIRDAVGIDEGDEVIVEVKDGILLKPVRKFDEEKLRKAFKEHREKLEKIPGLIEPKLGELVEEYLEEEFEE